MKTIIVAIAVLVLPFTALAAVDEQVVKTMAKQTGLSPKEIRESYNACDSGVTATMKICGTYRLTEQDMRLNRAYTLAVKKVDEGSKRYLIATQRAWSLYRDSQCLLEGRWNAGGGTAEGLYVLSCKLELTKQYAGRLEVMIQEKGK